MDIRFQTPGGHGATALADHARRRLKLRLQHRSDQLAYIAVKLGDTGSRRGRSDTYCVVRVQLTGLPAASVVDVGRDAYDTIDRASDRAGRLVEEQLRAALGRPAGGPAA
jgi:hypothetical protein